VEVEQVEVQQRGKEREPQEGRDSGDADARTRPLALPRAQDGHAERGQVEAAQERSRQRQLDRPGEVAIGLRR
jgi:hypothetical protein